ncbi:MAG: hypothetical protein N4A32_08165 [Marinifilaceae bacterium]|jgi:hypothetical protein|nr:hypothetical protein [Marinifilaceae bacterium]
MRATTITLIGLFSLLAVLFSSCAEQEENKAISREYTIEYTVDSNVEDISKIVYTDVTGHKTFAEQIDGLWKIKVSGTSGETVKLEVFGTHKDSGESNIFLQIDAKNGDDYIVRENNFKKNKNKYFHYYLISVLD